MIFNETICEIWNVLAHDYIKLPTNPNEWRIVANEFHQRWHFRCLGAIDGKHVMIKVVGNSDCFLLLFFSARQNQIHCTSTTKRSFRCYYWHYVTPIIVSRMSILEIMEAAGTLVHMPPVNLDDV